MSAELRVTFLGEHQDARKAVAALRKLVDVVAAAEAAGAGRGPRIGWRFSRLGLGSVVSGIAPATAGREGEAGDLFAQVVQGFGDAEEREGMPAGWSVELARRARDLIDAAEHHEMRLEALRQDGAVGTVRVTMAARRHLDAGLAQGARDSIGSLIGQLDAVSLHEKQEARLWPERGGPSVPVQFTDEQLPAVRDHLGARVEASGRLRRDAAGRPLSLRLRRLERLPTWEESPPLTDLIGLDPDFTGGKSSVEYLREIRGEAR